MRRTTATTNKNVPTTSSFLLETRGTVAFFFAISLVFCSFAEIRAEETRHSLAPEIVEDASGERVVLKAFGSISSLNSLEPFVLSLEMEIPIDSSLASNDLVGEYGDFLLEPLGDRVEPISDSRQIVERRWNAVPTRRGKAALPPLPLRLTLNNGETFVVRSAPLTFDVPETTLTKTIDDLGFDPTRARRDWFPIVATIAVLGAGIVAILLICRKKRVDSNATVIPKETPFEKATRRFEELKRSRAYSENKPDFYAELASILRVFLEERFGLNAEKMTTHEVLSAIDAFSPVEGDDPERFDEFALACFKPPEIRDKLERALNGVDLVKFARRATTFDDARELFVDAKFVADSAERLLLAELERRRSATENETSAVDVSN